MDSSRGPRHARVGPCIDVSACGARGLDVRFAKSIGDTTCPRCAELRTDPKIAEAQLAKMRKVGQAMRDYSAGGYRRK